MGLVDIAQHVAASDPIRDAGECEVGGPVDAAAESAGEKYFETSRETALRSDPDAVGLELRS